MSSNGLAPQPRVDERDTSSEAIYSAIRDGICLGDFRPGEVLSENVLASSFGVSRTPIRRVLQRLEFEGLVSTKDGLGTIVKILDVVSLKETYDLRIKLAELLGELSPNARVTEAHLARLEALLQRCRGLYAGHDVRELVRVNLAWHNQQM